MTIKSISFVVLLMLELGSLGCSRIAIQPAAEQENIDSRTARFDQTISDRWGTEPASESAAEYSSRCRANYQQREFDEAIADCSRAIELDAKAAEAYLDRGLAFRDKGQKPNAIRDFESFLQFSDNPMDRMQVEQQLNKLK